ncbi:MAG: flagellar basal body-associated FliL family protein [Phycisphaerae bacterium]|nr:flagellar basal body-associated FliL family protein [Phycisphaerae bacterium]
MAAEPTSTESAAPPKTSKKGKLIQGGVILALMAVEGVAIFYFANSLSPAPTSAQGAMVAGRSSEAEAASDTGKLSEIEIAECRTSNGASGKLVYFQVKVVALVDPLRLEDAKKLIEANKGRIQDRINFVFRSADLAHLAEPNLDTIKRRIKFELDRILDDPKLVQQVLLPDFTPSGNGL